MPRIDVPFIVKEQSIKQFPKVKIAAGGQNYFYATFNICSTWDEINKIKASFQSNYMNKPIIVDLVDGVNGYVECKIPWEVMTKIGYFDVGIFGGDRLLTSTARIFVIKGCMYDGNNPQAPTPDWFTNIEQKLVGTVPAPDTADVGQLLVVKTVDEKGKVTETEGLDEITLLINADLLPAVYNTDGKILTDNSGRIILRY